MYVSTYVIEYEQKYVRKTSYEGCKRLSNEYEENDT